MNEEALIIFARQPELGKVKTRLAATIGEEAALTIYKKLLAHTRAISEPLACDKYIFYTGEKADGAFWPDDYFLCRQATVDLGGRMKTAFAQLFNKGYHRICIIGSDCFELTTAIINNAFLHLRQQDVVVGPAKDGGYYLLGISNGPKAIFDGIEWSTARVLAQTKEKLALYGYRYSLLPLLGDVDTAADLPPELLQAFRHSPSGNES